MHRTHISWSKKEAHHRIRGFIVWEGGWAQKSNVNLPMGQGLEVLRVKAYVKDNYILSAVLQRPDYDPCGRTDWLVDEVWAHDEQVSNP